MEKMAISNRKAQKYVCSSFRIHAPAEDPLFARPTAASIGTRITIGPDAEAQESGLAICLLRHLDRAPNKHRQLRDGHPAVEAVEGKLLASALDTRVSAGHFGYRFTRRFRDFGRL